MRTAIVIIPLLLFWSPSWALDIQGTCYITFLGTSTLHDFTGTVRSKPFTVSLTEGERGGKYIHSVEVDVPVDEIDTDNKKRDRQMRKMFQSDRYPNIHGTMKEIRPDRLREELKVGSNEAVTIDLTLKIRDVDRVIPARIGNYREYGQQISFNIEFPVSLKEYNLNPPSLFFGLIRVGDRIDVEITFDLEIKPAELFSQNDDVQEEVKDAGVAAPH